MLIDIKTVLSESAETLADKVRALPYPALLLDEGLKILSVNSLALKYVSGLKTRVLIKRFVSPDDYLELTMMTEGQTVYVELIGNDRRYGATVIAGNGVRTAVIHPIISGIQSHVTRLYDRMSGYDLDIASPSDMQMRDVSLKSGAARLFIEKLEEMLRLRTLMFFNPAAVLGKLCDELARFIPSYTERIHYDAEFDEMIVCGSEQDFVLLLGVLISLCLGNTDGNIDLSLTEDLDNVLICLRADADECFYTTVKNALNGLSSKEVSEDATSFNLYLLKLIADGNLWELEIESDPAYGLCFTLRAGVTEPFGAIEFRDVSEEYILKILQALFA